MTGQHKLTFTYDKLDNLPAYGQAMRPHTQANFCLKRLPNLTYVFQEQSTKHHDFYPTEKCSHSHSWINSNLGFIFFCWPLTQLEVKNLAQGHLVGKLREDTNSKLLLCFPYPDLAPSYWVFKGVIWKKWPCCSLDSRCFIVIYT